MLERALIAYDTKHGSTAEVAAVIADVLRAQGTAVDVREADDVEDFASYDAVVVGGPLYMGRWHAASFLKQHRSELTRIPTAVFALGPISPTGDDRAGSERQLQRALGKVRGVEPVSVAVFGGVVDPTKLRFPFNHMPAGDARDWNAIRAWSERLATALEPSSDQPLANGS